MTQKIVTYIKYRENFSKMKEGPILNLEDTLDPRRCLGREVNIETGFCFSIPRVDFEDKKK